MGLSIFFLGCHAMVVQILLMRELLAAFSGNELTIGAAFGIWFAMISAGALAGRRAARFWASDIVRLLVQLTLFVLALLPPVLLFVLARSRGMMGIPAYGALPFGRLMLLFLVVLGPVCLGQGFVFPCACRLAAEGRKQGVSRMYGLESLGSLIGGAGIGVAVILHAAPLALAFAAGALGLAALAAATKRKGMRIALALAALICAAIPIFGTAELRRAESGWAAPHVRRVDTPYQRLTVARLGGQSVLYANSQPLFMFPDPLVAEPLVHGVLARHPEPRSVLLIGGNPADLGRALLAHPGCSVTYVETDPWIWRLTAGTAFPKPEDRKRFRVVHEDPVWYARKEDASVFDVILLVLPEPETVGLNRFYTVEFYRDLRRLLRPAGFLWTSVEASEQLRAETGLLAASVNRTLGACFPVVQATYGARIGFFASESAADAPMDAKALVASAERRGIHSEFFKPESFWADESIDPAKMARTRAALQAIPVEPNTLDHPVTHTFMLLRWNRFSGSGLERVLWRLAGLEGARLAERVSVAMGGIALLMALGLFLLRGRKRAGMVRGSLRMAIAVAGFSCMAFELILIFLAQSLFGYVYGRLAFIVALFMAGATAGALLVRRHEAAEPKPAWSLAIAACGALVVLGVALPLWRDSGLTQMRAAEAVLQGFMVLSGAAIGVLFPMVNRLLRESGEPLTSAAGETHAADNLGAGLGALAIGVVLIPVLGVGMACFILALGNALLALLLAAARRLD